MINGLNISIERTSRRTTSLAIYPDSRIVVSVPLRFPEARIKALLMERLPWIEKKLNSFRSLEKVKKREFKPGEFFPHLGATYSLSVIRTSKAYASILNQELVVSIPARVEAKREPEAIRKVLLKWYSEQAFEKLQERVNFYAARLRVTPKSISIRNYQNRWGTCKITGELVFNWRIILASEAVFNYVVIHELCHLIEFNHSPKFWLQVASEMPDYKNVKNQLKKASYQGELEL